MPRETSNTPPADSKWGREVALVESPLTDQMHGDSETSDEGSGTTFQQWSDWFISTVGLYNFLGPKLSTRILRRRIAGLSQRNADTLLAIVTALAQASLKSA